MRGFGWWHIGIGAMALGAGGVAVAGFMLVLVLIALLIGAGIFYGCKRVYRHFFPWQHKNADCPPELLAYWAANAKYLRRG